MDHCDAVLIWQSFFTRLKNTRTEHCVTFSHYSKVLHFSNKGLKLSPLESLEIITILDLRKKL